MTKSSKLADINLLNLLKEKSKDRCTGIGSSISTKRKTETELSPSDCGSVSSDHGTAKENRLAFQATSHTISSDSWEEYRDPNSASNIQVAVKAKSSSTGWRQIDGKRVYKTYRHGECVHRTGKEAFLEYLADDRSRGKRSKNK